MTAQIQRRLEALEAVGGDDKLVLLFVSWERAKGAGPSRLTTEWHDDQFTQERGEDEESFKARLRAAVNRNRPLANRAAVIFLDEIDAAL